MGLFSSKSSSTTNTQVDETNVGIGASSGPVVAITNSSGVRISQTDQGAVSGAFGLAGEALDFASDAQRQAGQSVKSALAIREGANKSDLQETVQTFTKYAAGALALYFISKAV